MNVYDSEKLKSILLSSGFSITEDERKADVIVLNTCSVREKAERRALGRLWDLSRNKSANPDVALVVAGCMAQRMGEELIQTIPCLDLVLGPDQFFQLPQYLHEFRALRQNNLDKPRVEVSESRESFSCEAFQHEELPYRKHKYISFVAISRGCNNFCSYCVVPYVRGPERHRPVAQIVKEIQLLAESGCKEVTLIGQNVNSYKCDGHDFADLLQTVSEETEIERIRFMTSHPKDLSEKLVNKMASLPKVCEHLHLPLQSGSGRILQKMNRAYTAGDYLKLVEMVKEETDGLSLTTDLIVGFPTETEEDFQQTLNMVEKVEFDSSFMFRYSVREGTKAASFPDDVPEDAKLERLHTLIDLQKKISQKKNQGMIGKSVEVLVDEVSRRDKNKWKGKTRNNKTVVIQADTGVLGKVAWVRVYDADSYTLFGKLDEKG